MARKGRNLEIDYAWLYGLNKEYKITSPAKLYDKIAKEEREVDVLLEYSDEKNINRTIAVETRDWNKKQNIMWPEQLITKKNDIGVDYLIAVSNQGFSEGAINKARHYGVIIEKANVFSKKTIDNIKNEFFMDVYYVIPIVEKLNILFDNNKTCSFHNFYKKLNIFEKNDFMNELNYNLFININFYDLINRCVDIKDFYNITGDNSAHFDGNAFSNNDRSPFADKYKIKSIYYKLKIIPYKLTLFLDKSVSIFEPDDNTNKKYRAVFGNEDDNISISYINNKDVNTEYNLKKRKYYKLIGGNAHINTIFNKDVVVNFNPEELIDSMMTEFDFTNLL